MSIHTSSFAGLRSVKYKAFKAIEPGAYLSSSWGYEQTNYDFFKVLDVKNGWAKLQQVEKIVVESNGEYMTSKVVPGRKIIGNVFRRKIKSYGQGYVAISSYASASPWDGMPEHQTHYA